MCDIYLTPLNLAETGDLEESTENGLFWRGRRENCVRGSLVRVLVADAVTDSAVALIKPGVRGSLARVLFPLRCQVDAAFPTMVESAAVLARDERNES